MSETHSKPKVLVIGWDAADWKVIHPLMDQGVMPHLSNMVEHGVMAEISTLHPVLSPMLWTSIATGKRPYKHGIYGFLEPTPDGMNVQPITNLSRSTKAVWNILNQKNMRSIVVGWWPSHPAEPINGAMVSNNYHRANTLTLDAPWPMPNGTVHPPELSDELAEVRLHPCEVTEELLKLFIPQAEKVDQDKDRRLWTCAKNVAECTSIHGAATHLLETQQWDFAAIYYDAIDHFSHGYMRYHPPRREHIPEEDFELFQHVVQCAYVYHDMMLGRLLELAGEDTTVILLSDHGFHPDHLRPAQIPSEPAGPAIEHRDFGIFVMKGPGIKQDQLIHGVNLLDITPTVLHLYGLPIADDMDGRVIADAFEIPPQIESIETWDDVPGEDGRHPTDRKLDAHESKEALQQLVDLGYVEPLGEDQEQNVANAICELNYNLARSYMDAHRFGDAVSLLHELHLKHPAEYRFGIQLAMCFKALNRIDDLDFLVSKLEQQRISDARLAQLEIEKYKKLGEERRAKTEQEQDSDAKPEAKAQTESSDNGDEFGANVMHPEGDDTFNFQEQLRLGKLMGLTRINRYALDFLKGYTKVAQSQYDEGLELLHRAAKAKPDLPGIHNQIGEAYLKLRKWDDAQTAFVNAREFDSMNPYTLLGLARCHLGRKENQRAIELALQSVGQLFFNPMAHYYLGVAFHRMGKIDRAVDALKLSIHQNPNNARALGRLGYIYKMEYGDLGQAREQFKLAGAARYATKQLREQAQQFEIPEFDPINEDALRDLRVRQDDDQDRQAMLPTLMQTTPQDVRERAARSDNSNFITIVTGLPRTGTSMMMQMLSNGGLAALTDGRREADDDNPKGYFELDDAKELATNNAWVENAQGKVIKVVAQLLRFLPKQFDYRVIFMDRAVEEILASQRKMLSRNQQSGGDITENQLRDVFSRQVKACLELLQRNRIPTMRIVYSQAIAIPEKTADLLRKFLNADLDVDKMVQAIDPTLYRQKKDELKTAERTSSDTTT